MPKGVFERKPRGVLPRKAIARCGLCLWSWRPTTGFAQEKCPKCGHPTSCRDRSQEKRRPDQAQLDKLNALRSQSADQRRIGKARLRLRVLMLVGNGVIRCVSCGCDRPELLEVNHKNGGGAEDRRSYRHVTQFYWAILKFERSTEDLDLTCKVCNALHYLELKHGSLPYRVSWDLETAR